MPLVSDAVEAALQRLATMSIGELRSEWRRQFGREAPKLQSKVFLRGFIAWRIQEKAYGGLSPETKRRLRQLAARFDRDPDYTPSPIFDLKPGIELTREWRGVLYRVRVLADGFEYAGERFATLSEVARRITGTRWSGPLFFGLKGARK
jgi:hypothetical protein